MYFALDSAPTLHETNIHNIIPDIDTTSHNFAHIITDNVFIQRFNVFLFLIQRF